MADINDYRNPDGITFDLERLITENAGSSIQFTATEVERYKAARRGEPFNPASIEHHYPEGRAGEKLKRRDEEPKIIVPLDDARDMFRVLENLNTFEEHFGASQLPCVPLRSLTPVAVINRVVDSWLHSIAGTPQQIHTDLREEIEAIVNLVLHEAHPDRQNQEMPRRRSGDSDATMPLLINGLARVRDLDDQQDFVEICEIQDREFNIIKSAVHAYATLIAQHGLDPNMDGVTELYRRGLLPLSILIESKEVLTAISGLTGRTEMEISEAIALVEPTHVEHRPEAISYLLNQYDNHIDASLRHRQELLAKQARDTSGRVTNIPPRKSSQPLSNTPTFTPSVQEKAESDLIDMIDRVGLIIMDSAIFSDDMRARVLGAKPFLPIPNRDVDLNPSSNEDFTILMNPANVWFETCHFNSRRTVPRTIADIDAWNDEEPYERTVSTLAHLFNARATDIYVEGVIAFTVACDIIENAPRDQQFIKLVKSLSAVTAKLETLHRDSILAVVNGSVPSQDLVSTDPEWGKIVHNPHTNQQSDHVSIINGIEDQRLASMMFHVPFGIVDKVFNNSFTGMGRGYDRESFDECVASLKSRDRNGSILKLACSVRSRLGTAGRSIISGNGTITMDVGNPERLRDIFEPVANRYTGLDLSTRSFRQSLLGLMTTDPREPSRSARVAER